MTFDEAMADLRAKDIQWYNRTDRNLLAIAEEVERLRQCICQLTYGRYVVPPVREGEAPGVHQMPPASEGLYFQITESVPCAPNVFVVDNSDPNCKSLLQLPELSTVDSSEPTEGDRMMEFFKGDGA